MKNTAALWRLELDALLEAEASTRSPADRRKAFGEIAATMRRNPKLIAGLRAEGRHLLDARAAGVGAVERLAVVFPDRAAEEAFESALAAALSWCLDLEARAKIRDTEKKSRVAIPRTKLTEEFCRYLARKRTNRRSTAAEALDWLYRKCMIKSNVRKDLTKEELKKVNSLARVGQRFLQERDSK